MKIFQYFSFFSTDFDFFTTVFESFAKSRPKFNETRKKKSPPSRGQALREFAYSDVKGLNKQVVSIWSLVFSMRTNSVEFEKKQDMIFVMQ